MFGPELATGSVFVLMVGLLLEHGCGSVYAKPSLSEQELGAVSARGVGNLIFFPLVMPGASCAQDQLHPVALGCLLNAVSST